MCTMSSHVERIGGTVTLPGSFWLIFFRIVLGYLTGSFCLISVGAFQFIICTIQMPLSLCLSIHPSFHPSLSIYLVLSSLVLSVYLICLSIWVSDVYRLPIVTDNLLLCSVYWCLALCQSCVVIYGTVQSSWTVTDRQHDCKSILLSISSLFL